MSFSSTSMACPFLVGEEDGTVPLGSALKNKLSSFIDGFLFIFFHCFSAPTTSFLPSKHEQSEENKTKKTIREELDRAMLTPTIL
jgi:hypothetical protein